MEIEPKLHAKIIVESSLKPPERYCQLAVTAHQREESIEIN
jgi:hypothetical protein